MSHPLPFSRPPPMEGWQRRLLHGGVFFLAASGIAFLLAHFFLRQPGQFGASVHPLEPWSMRLHGASAMLGLFALGSIVTTHVRRNLRGRRNLISGWCMILAWAVLILTGYGLYYLAADYRTLWSTLHWAMGLAFVALVVLHTVLGKRARVP